jgi:hypothetical protein
MTKTCILSKARQKLWGLSENPGFGGRRHVLGILEIPKRASLLFRRHPTKEKLEL